MTLAEFVLHNIAPIAGLFYLLIVLGRNASLSPWERKQFYILWALEVLELVAYNAERVTAAWSQPTMLRILLSAIGYSLRPGIIYVLPRLVCAKEYKGWKGIMLRLPALLAVIVGFSAFFTDIVYSYDAVNQFHRGPLGYAPHILLTIYVVVFTVVVFQRRILEERVEQRVMILSAVYVIVTMIAESALSLYGIGRTAIVLSTIFFLSALQTAKLKDTIYALQENEELKLTLHRLETAQNELLHNKSVMQALGENYMSVLYAVPERNEVRIEKLEEHFSYFLQMLPTGPVMALDAVTEAYARAFVVPEEREAFLATFRREALMETMAQKKSMTLRFNCREENGPVFCVEYHLIRAGGSLSDGIILGMRDVEEQVQKERAQLAAISQAMDSARLANAAKSDFLSRMSHDIRTPLNGIIGILEIDKQHKDDPELLNRNREKLKVAAHHLLSLVNDILDMNKLESGDIALAHEAFSIGQLHEDVIAIVEPQAAEAGLTFSHEEDTAFPYPNVYGSPLHLRQILLNIYGNAIKYNRTGGSIRSRLEYLGREEDRAVYRLTIADTGIGMSRAFMPHLFEPFVQERTDARSVYQGTGLGMAIVKGLVEKMDGTITVDSIQGEGSSFAVTIPFEISNEGQLSAPADEDAADIQGVRILLAEDNALNMEIATTLLSEAGAVITPVANGKAAVEAFSQNPPGTFDVILMDIMMPVMDGMAAARTIRGMQRADAARIPIIAMTANAFDEDMQASKEAGMNAHLAKPLNIARVISEISRLVSHAG